MISTAALTRETGVTYRQLNYWIEQGFFHAIEEDHPGSGVRRYFSGTEAAIARLMARMVMVGFAPPAAAEIARSMIENHLSTRSLGHGLVLQDLR